MRKGFFFLLIGIPYISTCNNLRKTRINPWVNSFVIRGLSLYSLDNNSELSSTKNPIIDRDLNKLASTKYSTTLVRVGINFNFANVDTLEITSESR